MGFIFKRASGWQWNPDADDVNAPDGTLLRADNTVPEVIGARSVRMGSETIHTGMSGPVRSMRTPTLNGTIYRIAGAGDDVYVDGTRVSADFKGAGDIAIGDDSYQAFFARGKTKKKWEGSNIYEWGIAAPSRAAELGAIDAVQYFVATFGIPDTMTASTIAFAQGTPDLITDSGNGFVTAGITAGSTVTIAGGVNDGISVTVATAAAGTLTLVDAGVLTTASAGTSITLTFGEDEAHGPLSGLIPDTGANALELKEGAASAFTTNYAGISSTAYLMTAAAGSGTAACQKKYASDIDMLTFPGSLGGDEDIFDMRVWLENPRVVDKVTIMFGLNTGTDPFLDDYYYFDFNIRNTGTVNLKDSASASSTVYATSIRSVMSPRTPQEATEVRDAVQASKILRDRGRFAGSRSKERPDSTAASPAWGHMSVNRGQFSRVGNTPGRSWKTVRGFKVVYTVTPGATSAQIGLDDAIWTGGGNRALNGTFNVGYRFARRVFDNNLQEVYTELSPMSPISEDIALRQQTLQVTIPAVALSGKDAQVDSIWIYVYGGWLDTYYRFAIVPAVNSNSMTIDDIATPTGTMSEWVQMRFAAYAFLYGSGTAKPSTGSGDLVVRIYKSELEAMTENEPFEPGALEPPDNIISIAGPVNKRLFCLTSEGWLWPSTLKSPSSYSLYHSIDLRMYGTPYWVVSTPSGVFVGCSKDIIRIDGSGDDIDMVMADLYPTPLHVANPPVDGSVSVEGNSIFFRAADGPMQLAGVSSSAFPDGGTTLLWRGHNRHGIQAIDTTNGRFRYAVDNHMIYMLVAEGSNPTATIRYTTAVPKNNRVVTIDGYKYILVDNLSGSGKTEVLIGTPEETATNLVSAINFTTGNGTTYAATAAHPYVTATIDTATKLITLSGTSNSKLSLVTSEPSFYASEFETLPTSLWRFSHGQWSRLIYPSTLMSLHREPDGSLLAGTYDGKVIEIEIGTSDDSSPIYVEILTPNSEGDSPVSRKDPADLQLQVLTGGSVGNVDVFIDRASTPALSTTFSTLVNGIYRINILPIGPFLRTQLEIYGYFTKFLLHAVALTASTRPPHVMAVDLGTLVPEQGADLAWINQVEVDVESNYDLELLVYKNGALHSTQTITVTPGFRDAYTLILPKNTKGRRLGLVLQTTAADSEGFNGFELYGIRVRHATTGNEVELPVSNTDSRSDG